MPPVKPQPLTEAEIAALRRLLEGATTPRPWSWDWHYDADRAEAYCGIQTEGRSITLGHAYAVARCPRYQKQERWEGDAALIVGAVQALPALLAEIERGRSSKDAALVRAVIEWASSNEGRLDNPNDADLLKALWTHDGDRTAPCPECDGDCGEPCAPCTVADAHASLDAFSAQWREERGIVAQPSGGEK